MLTSTFCHIPGIGPTGERRIWSAGFESWQHVLDANDIGLPPRIVSALRIGVRQSLDQLASGEARFFAGQLPTRELWRLLADFRSSIAYVDIETTGLGMPGDHITTIALYDGTQVLHYVHGQNLADFARDIGRYKVIVTYNGKCFDIPFIQRTMGLAMDQAHIDLRYLLKNLGYSGGLKGCERQLGLDRGELDGVDGYMAVLLWQEYTRNGNQKALDTLLAYNIQDVVNLESLLVLAYNMKIASTPFAQTHRLVNPESPTIPFIADRLLIQSMRRRFLDFEYRSW